MQKEPCNSLILLPNTAKHCVDKPSRSVKHLLSPLGALKKSQFVLLKFPDSHVTASGSSSLEKVSQKLLVGTGCVGEELRGQQVQWAMGCAHVGSREAPGIFPTWLLWARPQIW